MMAFFILNKVKQHIVEKKEPEESYKNRFSISLRNIVTGFLTLERGYHLSSEINIPEDQNRVKFKSDYTYYMDCLKSSINEQNISCKKFLTSFEEKYNGAVEETKSEFQNNRYSYSTRYKDESSDFEEGLDGLFAYCVKTFYLDKLKEPTWIQKELSEKFRRCEHLSFLGKKIYDGGLGKTLYSQKCQELKMVAQKINRESSYFENKYLLVKYN
jgi:hypothetical protein